MKPSLNLFRASAFALSFAALGSTISACGGKSFLTRSTSDNQSKIQLANMTKSEAIADFNYIVENFKRNYGPLKFKEQRFGYKFADLIAEARAKLDSASTDAEFFEIYATFLGAFQDGHVSFRAPVLSGVGEVSAQIPIALMPVEGKALVEELLDPSLLEFGIAPGDEVVSVDGVSPFEIAERVAKMRSSGNPESNKHAVYNSFFRGSYMGKLYPAAPSALVKVRKPDGAEFDVTLS
jgi:hypothetical protein